MSEAIQAFLFQVASVNQRVVDLAEEGVLETSHTTAPVGDDNMVNYFGFEVRLRARQMGAVYELLYCLENSVRELVRITLTDVLGTDQWWDAGVPDKIRKSAESRKKDEEGARWHGPRGGSLLNYVDFASLGEIIVERWTDFEDLLGDRDWVENYFKEINRTRRALAHTGQLSQQDVDWMEMRVSQWLRVVG